MKSKLAYWDFELGRIFIQAEIGQMHVKVFNVHMIRLSVVFLFF